MTSPIVATHGSWKSPITSEMIVAETIALSGVLLDGDDIYWLEQRPSEGGRSVVVRHTPDGSTTDVTPPEFNARTRVHEYGGGSYLVHAGTVFFSDFKDQRLYRQPPDAPPAPITPPADRRYADGIFDAPRNRLVFVREDHTVPGREPVNTICAVDPTGSRDDIVLVSGSDFYSSPRLSPDGTRLAWLQWNHPNMPWDGTELRAASVAADGSLRAARKVAGGTSESIAQPEWSPDGILYFVSDRTGWWNIYRCRGAAVEPVCPVAAEFTAPAWGFRLQFYAFASADRIICAYAQRGLWRLGELDTNRRTLRHIDSPYTTIGYVQATPAHAVFCGGAPAEPTSVVRLDLATGRLDVLRKSSRVSVGPGYLSAPEAIEFPTTRGRAAHAFFYPPANRDYTAPIGERPPLLVTSHGGPTAAASSALSLNIQYWTSRGFAVVDVNYGGSTGYGREYRERLRGQWGVVDVDDCVNAALYLVRRGSADPDRLAIRGGSAGGYTTLCALTFRNVFKAGASYYGISDAEALARETHKFESRYLDGLIGPYPQRRDLYRERSPIDFVDRLSCPLILFQGLDDKIVPPNQSERMFDALRAKGVPVAYVPFEGEQHGFRMAQNIRRALDAELYFYSRIFRFGLPDHVEPVRIENLPG